MPLFDRNQSLNKRKQFDKTLIKNHKVILIFVCLISFGEQVWSEDERG